MLSRNQAKGHATKSVKSRIRWHKVLEVSAAGGSKADACAAAGLSIDGLNSLMRKRVGNQQWPVQEQA